MMGKVLYFHKNACKTTYTLAGLRCMWGAHLEMCEIYFSFVEYIHLSITDEVTVVCDGQLSI